MVALVTSILIAAVLAGGIHWYAKRRPVDTPTTWGEAMVGAVYVFFLLFLIFGVIPHQWLTLAENEWSFRADRLFDGWGLIEAQSQDGWFPFEITYRVLSDSIAAILYIVFLGAMVHFIGMWQARGEKAKARSALPTSSYGRPLVKRG